jgi:hypothetical protein
MASVIRDRLRHFVQTSGEEDQQTLERGDPACVAPQCSIAAATRIEQFLTAL